MPGSPLRAGARRLLASVPLLLPLLLLPALPAAARAQCDPTDLTCDAQAPTVTITPSGGSWSGASSTHSLPVTVGWCDNRTLDPATVWLRLDGVAVTGQYAAGTKAGCVAYATSTLTLNLSAGTHTFTASISDESLNTGQGSASYAYTASGRTAPQLSFAPHHGGFRDATRNSVTAGYSTPAYISLDEPRSVSLLYASAQAQPLGFVQVDATDGSGTAPDRMSIRVKNELGAWMTDEIFYRAGSGATRLAAHFAESRATPAAYRYDVVVRSYWPDGQFLETVAQARIPIVSARGSALGHGWSVAGLPRVYEQTDGALLVESGAGAFFTKLCDAAGCRYVAPAGDYTTLVKDAQGWLHTLPAKESSTRFGTDGVARSSTRRDGSTVTYHHTGARLDSISDPAGMRIRLGYNASGKLAYIDDPGGRRTTVSVDALGDLRWIKDPTTAYALQAGYDAEHRMTYRINERSGRFDFSYDRAAKVDSVLLPTVVADGASVRPVQKVRSVEAVVLAPAGAGTSSAPAARVLPDTVAASFWDARGNRTRVTVDRFGNSTRTVDALGRTTTIVRDTLSRVSRGIGIGADTVDYTYHGSTARVYTMTQRRTGHTVYYQYTDDGRLLNSQGAPVDVKNEYEYDATLPYEYRWGDLIFTRTGSEAYFSELGSHSNNVRRVEKLFGPRGERTYSYASSGTRNVTSELDRDGTRFEYTYDAHGRTLKVVDSRGDSVRYEYDALNRPTRVTDAAGNATRYEYGATWSRVIDAKNQVYETTVNALGWVTSVKDPLLRTESFAYDRAGNQTRYTNRRGGATTYGYDALNRRVWRDADGRRTTYSFGPNDDFTAASNGEATDTVFTTPRTDRTVLVRHVTVRGARRHERQVVLNERGQPVSAVTVGVGRDSVRYTYDDASADDTHRLTSVRANGATTSVVYADSILKQEIRLPGGVTAFLHPDYVHYSPVSIGNEMGIELTADAFERVQRRLGFTSPLRTDTDSTRSFRYDAAGRLSARADTVVWNEPVQRTVCEGGSCWTETDYVPHPQEKGAESYTYDAAGNRTDSGASVGTGNRLSAFRGYTIQYDLDGNVTAKYLTASPATFDQRLYWNTLGQLDSVKTTRSGVTTRVAFGYDGLGRRVRKTVGSTTVWYVYEGGAVVKETDGAGSTLAEYVHYPEVDRPHSTYRSGQSYYYLSDGPGSVTGLTNGSGQLVNRYRYTPWGEPETTSEAVANPFRFTGREHDAETGLYFYRARYYDPALGRFVSEDPAGLSGGINPYAYAENDPVNLNDPSGLLTCTETGWGRGRMPGVPDWRFRMRYRYECPFTFPSLAGGAWMALPESDFLALQQEIAQAEENQRREELKLDAVRSSLDASKGELVFHFGLGWNAFRWYHGFTGGVGFYITTKGDFGLYERHGSGMGVDLGVGPEAGVAEAGAFFGAAIEYCGGSPAIGGCLITDFDLTAYGVSYTPTGETGWHTAVTYTNTVSVRDAFVQMSEPWREVARQGVREMLRRSYPPGWQF